jgi:hypothetical protein
VKYQLSIEVLSKSEKPYFFEYLGFYDEPNLEFDRLDDLVAFLNRIADATGELALRQYAGKLKLEGDASEKVVRDWDNRKEVRLKTEVEKAIVATRVKSTPAKK